MKDKVDPRLLTMLAMLRDYYRGSSTKVAERWGPDYTQILFGADWDDLMDSRLHAEMFAWATEQLLISMGVEMTEYSDRIQDYSSLLARMPLTHPTHKLDSEGGKRPRSEMQWHVNPGLDLDL